MEESDEMAMTWPGDYQPPAVEELGSVWERTGSGVILTGDNLDNNTT